MTPATLDAFDVEWDVMLEAAIRGDGVSTVFQPIIDTARGTVVGYEALARFTDAHGDAHFGPSTWFSQARRHGLAADLEVAALRAALRARPSLPANCFLTVNVSPDLLTSRAVREVWFEQGDLSGLVIELTEHLPIDSYEALEPELELLRAAGALIAVDDTGSGYSGLQHLVRIRPSVIKLDRALVENVDRDTAKLALVEMIGSFASRIDAWLLAEGVERIEELDTLAALGVPLVQGFALAHPNSAWADIDPVLSARLAATRTPTSSRVVRDLVEPAVVARTTQQASAFFAADRDLEVVVLVDAHERPTSVVTPAAARQGVTPPALKVNVDTLVTAAMTRAMTRDARIRFDALLATDNAGRLAGIVRMERMIGAITELAL